MNYQTFVPCKELSPVVRCYWTLESPKEKSPQKQVVVADGCMEMVFHFGDLYKQYIKNGASIIQPRCFVIGQLTRPLEIEPTGKTDVFSIRFHPDGFFPLATLPIKELENTAVSLERLFGKTGQELEQKMLSAPSTPERISLVETFLLTKLAEIETIDRTIKSTVDTILCVKGNLTVNDLSKQFEISRRQLERKFSTAIGLSPKQLLKTIRIQEALKMLLNKEFSNLTALAYQGEYYDQAHFTKDFKEFTGLSPKEFFGEGVMMSALFYGKK